MSKDTITFEGLADKLTDSVMEEKVVLPNRKASMSFEYGGTTSSSYEGFMKTAVSYVKHQAKTITGVEISDADARKRAEEYLESSFQQEGGAKGAYKLAKKDLVGTIQRLGNGVIAHEKNRKRKEVFDIVDPFDYDAKVKLAGQYLDLVNRITPGTETRRAGDLANELPDLLMTYVNIKDAASNSVEYHGPKRQAA